MKAAAPLDDVVGVDSGGSPLPSNRVIEGVQQRRWPPYGLADLPFVLLPHLSFLSKPREQTNVLANNSLGLVMLWVSAEVTCLEGSPKYEGVTPR